MMPAFISAVVALVQPPAAAQPPATPILRQTFTESEEGWQALGDIAKVRRVTTPRAALAFEYKVSKLSLGLLNLPLTPGKLDGARSLKFAIKVDTTTPVIVSLQEQDGGRYSAAFMAPKDTWQDVALATTDFALGRDPGDPADPNGRLDMDKVVSVGIVDVASFFVRAENPALAALFPVTEGPRELLLAGFSIEKTALPPVTLDGLNRPQLGWLSLGGGLLRRAPAENPLQKPALELTYAVGPQQVAGLVHALPSGVFTGKQELKLTAAVAKTTTLIVQLEDDAGGKFNTTVEVPGPRVPKTLTIALSSLKRADDSKTDQLDLSHVKQLVLIDATGMLESVSQSNTLYLAGFEAK